jgi:hypothetical protein
MVTATTAHLRELDRRMTGGIEVTLLWNRLDNSLIVSVSDTAHRMQLQFGVEPSTARDAFNHPYPTPPHKACALRKSSSALDPPPLDRRFYHDHVDARSVRASTQSTT